MSQFTSIVMSLYSLTFNSA